VMQGSFESLGSSFGSARARGSREAQVGSSVNTMMDPL
jgi:hypothetical protein